MTKKVGLYLQRMENRSSRNQDAPAEVEPGQCREHQCRDRTGDTRDWQLIITPLAAVRGPVLVLV